MENKSKNDNENVIVKNKRRKWPLVLIISLITIILVVALSVVISTNVQSAKQEKALQEQLDLGNKYLNELDYEQAIVAYEAAIEIDPMSVDAYMGLADTYVNMEDFEKAKEVLQAGYDATGDERLKDKIIEIVSLIAEEQAKIESETQEDLFTFEISQEELNAAIPARVVDGIYHNAYYDYNLQEDDVEYLNNIINLLENGQYDDAIIALDYEKSLAILHYIGADFNGGDLIDANIALNNKKIYMEVDNRETIGEGVNIMILPIDDGKGYAISYHSTMELENYIGSYRTSYLYGECKEGVFWGEFSCVEVTDYEDNSIDTNRLYKGTSINGLLDGELTCLENEKTIITTLVNGHKEYWGLKQEDNKVYVTFEKEVTASGEKIDHNTQCYWDYDLDTIKSWYDNNLVTIEYTVFSSSGYGYESYYRIEDGMWYYPW